MVTTRPLNKRRQFVAILHKNFILQTRGRRSFLGIGGLAGLIFQLLLPVSFFVVMYLPKNYIKPIRHGETLGGPPIRLESRSWGEPYDGPATLPSHGGRAALLLTPDTAEVRGLAVVLAKTLACPRDPQLRTCPSANLPASFHCMFMPRYDMVGGSTIEGTASPIMKGASLLEKGDRGVEDSTVNSRTGGGGGERGRGGEPPVTIGWPYWTSNEEGGSDGGGRESEGGGGLQLWWRRRRLRQWQHRQQLSLEAADVSTDEAAAVAVLDKVATSSQAVAEQGESSLVVAAEEAAAGTEAVESVDGPTADPCADFTTCVASPTCYDHVLRSQISFVPNLEAARHATVIADQKWDAVVHFPRAMANAASTVSSSWEGGGEDSGSSGGDGGSSGGDGRLRLQRLDMTRLSVDTDGGRTAAKSGGESSSFDSGGAQLLDAPAVNGAGGFDDTGAGGGVHNGIEQSVAKQFTVVTVGMNHTDVPHTKFLLDLFDVLPTKGNGLGLYRRYWFFANLQMALHRAVIGIHVAANTPPPEPSPDPSPSSSTSRLRRQQQQQQQQREEGVLSIAVLNDHGNGEHGARRFIVAGNRPYDTAVPVNVEVSYKAFPWPAVTEDLGAAGAAVFFQLLLVYAFLPPTRAVVGDIVREKELRLREGMGVLGLSDLSYWLSWGLTHWILLAVSGALCTAAGVYPFANSSAAIMLAFFWLYGAALVSYSYCMSTLFTSSRVAGTVVQLLYALSMIPGFIVPTMYPYGSWIWYVACLSPPSAATLFAAVLVNWEKVAEGIRPSTLWTPITQANGFCAATVLWMLVLDVVVYGLLTWYLDKVLPKTYGQRLPWWFVFDRRYWNMNRGAAASRSIRRHGRFTSGGGGGVHSVRMLSGGIGQWLVNMKSRFGEVKRESLVTTPFLDPTPYSPGGDSMDGADRDEGAVISEAAVEVRDLVKVFRTLTGEDKVAVDHLNLKIESGRITALLGHNGAGKTTTIHILTGMVQPTAGSATVNGFDVATQMDYIRASLGICPQFDILWPDLTVYEHLELYGAIKGFKRDELPEIVASASASVGLTPKLDCPAGELSGGQRRKLSVAIAFLGNPAVVFLDEPTSGMDPYSRRFTWEVIRRHRSEAAIVLTTHSMEEADLLGDQVVILAHGRVAAQGTGMELKANYGVGYNLTLVMEQRQLQPPQVVCAVQSPDGCSTEHKGNDTELLQPPLETATADASEVKSGIHTISNATAVMTMVRRHVHTADLLSAAGAEIVVRLPREAAGAFPALLRDLDGPVGRQQLGVASYGLSLTTLEEVFLSITAAAEQHSYGEDPGDASSVATTDTAAASTALPSPSRRTPPSSPAASASAGAPPPPTQAPPLYGWRLYRQQLRALLTKRALCARRDRLAVLTQLAVPMALVYLALFISSLQVREPSEPAVDLSRRTALFGRPLIWSATDAVRKATDGCSQPGGGSGGSCLAALLAGHPAGARSFDSGATAVYGGDPGVRSSTLEDYLLRIWYRGGSGRGGGSGSPVYDALHFVSLPPPAALATTAAKSSVPPFSIVLLTNQSAVSALPAALADAMTAAWSYINTGLPEPAAAPSASATTGQLSFSAISWPLPTLPIEPIARIQRDAASLMLVLCLVLASSVLSASFVVFIVREQDNNSKHLQLVSGAPATAYWAANYGWDLISYSVSAGGLLAIIVSYRLPQYSGPRLPAVVGLLWGFGPAGISLTYLLHFLFKDEMKALQRLNTTYFLTGYLGFVATWMCDLILMFVPQAASLAQWNRAVKTTLRTASPHYCFARGMYDVQATYNTGFPFSKRSKPMDWDVFGSPMVHMALQTLVYSSLVVMYDAGVFMMVYAYCQDAARGVMGWLRRQRQLQGRDENRQWGQRWWWKGHSGGAGGDEATSLLAMEQGLPLSSAAAATLTNAPFGDISVIHGRGANENSDVAEDEDVFAERVAVMEGRRNCSQVLLDGVRKSYSQGFLRPAVAAVRGLWVGVPPGECFGLLGVNGAGKTTTFRMLTGEVMPDAGDARVGGYSVRTHLAEARRQLGYCPQFEALPGAMTGREVAVMYARLRGVSEARVGSLVSYLLSRLGLEAAADTPCVGYSGGMKRKLGVAVALVGDPRVCALDEPSTGMDPGARRGLWTCLQTEVIGAGRTVVLTSHSMEECEALCTRLTILVAGRLTCLGTVQHLKSRFGGGYVLEIKTLPRSRSAMSLEGAAGQSSVATTAGTAVGQSPLERSDAVTAPRNAAALAVALTSTGTGETVADDSAVLTAWVTSVCPGAVLNRVEDTRFTFTLPRAVGEQGRTSVRADGGPGEGPAGGGVNSEAGSSGGGSNVDLSALFEAVESNRAALGVVDYCLTQTTLDQLFVSMAAVGTAGETAERL